MLGFNVKKEHFSTSNAFLGVDRGISVILVNLSSFIMVYRGSLILTPVAERSFLKSPSFEFVESLTKSYMFKVSSNKK